MTDLEAMIGMLHRAQIPAELRMSADFPGDAVIDITQPSSGNSLDGPLIWDAPPGNVWFYFTPSGDLEHVAVVKNDDPEAT